MTVITYAGGADVHPDYAIIGSATTTSTPGTVVHTILDGPPVYTLRPAEPLRGTLHLGFVDEQDARDALEVHRLPSVFRITSSTRGILNFAYIVTGGDLRLELDAETASVWVLEVPYQVAQ